MADDNDGNALIGDSNRLITIKAFAFSWANECGQRERWGDATVLLVEALERGDLRMMGHYIDGRGPLGVYDSHGNETSIEQAIASHLDDDNDFLNREQQLNLASEFRQPLGAYYQLFERPAFSECEKSFADRAEEDGFARPVKLFGGLGSHNSVPPVDENETDHGHVADSSKAPIRAEARPQSRYTPRLKAREWHRQHIQEARERGRRTNREQDMAAAKADSIIIRRDDLRDFRREHCPDWTLPGRYKVGNLDAAKPEISDGD